MKTIAALVITLALTISTATNAQTATTTSTTTTTTAATAAPATASCEIVSILKGGVLEVGKEPISFALKTKGCETEISSISANGLEFTDLAFKPGRVTAKVKVTDKSITGTAGFKLVDKDDNETESPDSVYLLVLGPTDVHVKTIADKAMAVNALTSKKVRALETKVETVSVTRPTRDEVATAITPLQRRIVDLEKVVVAMREEVEMANNRVSALGSATATLAENQVALGNTQVKRGFWGKKPLNPEVAAAAKQIRDAFVPPPTPVAANN